jgi:hypothetical protein
MPKKLSMTTFPLQWSLQLSLRKRRGDGRVIEKAVFRIPIILVNFLTWRRVLQNSDIFKKVWRQSSFSFESSSLCGWGSGLPDQTKNPNLGKYWTVLQWNMLVYYMIFCLFYGHFNFITFGIFVVIWYIFSRFGTLHQVKSGNPGEDFWEPWATKGSTLHKKVFSSFHGKAPFFFFSQVELGHKAFCGIENFTKKVRIKSG